MSILKNRDSYKPFHYPFAYKAYKLARAMAWEPHEIPLAEDVSDWSRRLTDNERSLLTQLFRFFTQADVDIARGYFEKYGPRFPHPEVRMMFGAFMDMEANHIDAYSNLIDTLGIPESEYSAFQNYKAMRDKHEFMFDSTIGHSITDLAVDIAVFSAFGEGMQLFSSFAILLSFQKRGLLKGMSTTVEWSMRDESLHVASMIELFHTLIKEHPRVWNDETKKRIYETARRMVELEDAFIDQAFSLGAVDGIDAESTKRYIRYIADRRLLQLGLKPNFGVKENPFDWLDWLMNAPTHSNFFETRSTEYSKGAIPGWEKAFDFLKPRHQVCELPIVADSAVTPTTVFTEARYFVFTMPGCPHCVRAEEALESRGIKADIHLVDNPDERAALKTQFGWKSFPIVIDTKNSPPSDFSGARLVGGADALLAELAQCSDFLTDLQIVKHG
jgi:ribonucleoside-diphosphate reductase beta chain